MKDQIAIELIEGVIKEVKEFIERIENAKIKNSLVSHGFVVWNPVAKMAMTFKFKDVGNGRRQAIGGRLTGILFAEHYTKEDATVLAADTLCGPDNVPAVAMFINDAIDLTISESYVHIANMESHLQA